MSTELLGPHDGATLARSVRSIATRAQRALKRPAAPDEARELLEVIASLEDAAQVRSSKDLARWLASLRSRVESHARTGP